MGWCEATARGTWVEMRAATVMRNERVPFAVTPINCVVPALRPVTMTRPPDDALTSALAHVGPALPRHEQPVDGPLQRAAQLVQ